MTNAIRRDEQEALFLRAVGATAELWRSLDVRVIATRIGSDWHNVLLRCRLDARPPGAVPALHSLPQTPRVMCLQEILAAGRLPALLEQLRSGVVPIAGHEIHVQSIDAMHVGGQPARSFLPYDDAAAQCPGPIRTATPTGTRDYVGHQLWIRGSNHFQLFQHVDGGLRAAESELHALEKPWNGIGGLARIALRSADDPTRSDVPAVEIAAPLGVAIEPDSIRLETGVLSAVVVAESREAAASSSIGVITERDDGSYGTRSYRIASTFRGRGERRAKVRVSVGRSTRRAALMLRVGPHLVETREVIERVTSALNPHVGAFSYFDPGLAGLRKALEVTDETPKRTKEAPHHFERAVACLFSLGGFLSDAVDAFPGVQNAVDVLARTPDGSSLLAIECTIGALNAPGGKPNRLASRAHGLCSVEALREAEIIPVMITSRARASLSGGDLDFVAHNHVSVLCQEELQELLARILEGATIPEIVSYCKRQVPITTDHRLQMQNALARVRR
jgi:hypothetical protein